MSEQLALQNGSGQGAATDGHKWFGLAQTAVVNQVGKQFLTGAAFTGDQDGRFGIGNLFRMRDAFADLGAFPDDGITLTVFS